MRLSSSGHVYSDTQGTPAVHSVPTESFPTSLAAFKRTSEDHRMSHPAAPHTPLTSNSTPRTKEDRPRAFTGLQRRTENSQLHDEKANRRRTLPASQQEQTKPRPPLHVQSQPSPQTPSPSTQLPRISSGTKPTAKRASRAPFAATPPLPNTAKDKPGQRGTKRSLSKNTPLPSRTQARSGQSQRPSHPSRSASRSRQPAVSARKAHGPRAGRLHSQFVGSRAPIPTPPSGSQPFSRRAGGLSEGIAAFKIQRAVRQRLLYPTQRLSVTGLSDRVRERMAIESKLDAVRIRQAKRTLARFFSHLSDLHTFRVERLKHEINSKAAAIVSAFLQGRISSAVCAGRRLKREKAGVLCIERAWRRSPLYATVSTLSQDAHALRLLERHEMVERRELMRQRLAYLILRHQQAYNDPRMIAAGLATRCVPLTASSILLGSGAARDDGGALAALLDRSFHDDAGRTLRLFERRAFFSAQESQLLIEENLLEIAPPTYEKPSRCADIFNFESFIHNAYATMLQQQEQARTAGLSEKKDENDLEQYAEPSLFAGEDDANRAALDSAVTREPRAVPTAHDAVVASLRADPRALAARAATERAIMGCAHALGGSRSAAYRAILSGVLPSLASAPVGPRAGVAIDISFAEVREAVNGVQHIALTPPTLNALLVQPRFHSCGLFSALVHDMRSRVPHPAQGQSANAAGAIAGPRSSAFRLGALADATTARFLSRRHDDEADVSVESARGNTDSAPFLVSAEALGVEWSQWLRMSAEDVRTPTPVTAPRSAVSASCGGRQRVQCILADGPAPAPLLDDFLPPLRVAEEAALMTNGGLAAEDRTTPLRRSLLSQLERLLVHEHRHREQLCESWTAQWTSVTLLAGLQRPQQTRAAPAVAAM